MRRALAVAILASLALVAAAAAAPGKLRLVPSKTTLPNGKTVEWTLRVVDGSGRTVTRFEPEMTKLMHLILVRDDLTGYQHLHPARGAGGAFHVPIRMNDPGRYRAVADVKTGGTHYSLTTDVTVPGKAKHVPLPPPATRATAAGYRVDFERPKLVANSAAHLSFRVSRGGQPVNDLQPYLGAFGHLVGFRMGTLTYSHVHPMGRENNTITFHARFPQAGHYRLFLQFRAGGAVRTAPFTVDVAPKGSAGGGVVNQSGGGASTTDDDHDRHAGH